MAVHARGSLSLAVLVVCCCFLSCGDTAVFFQVISIGWFNSFRSHAVYVCMGTASPPGLDRSMLPCMSGNMGKMFSSLERLITDKVPALNHFEFLLFNGH